MQPLQNNWGRNRALRPMRAISLCFFRRTRGHLTGLLASYVNEMLACSDSSFSQLTEEVRKRFEVKSREYDKMRFSGVYIDLSDSGFNIHQRPYIDRLKPLQSDANFALLRQYRSQLLWIIHSRPDVCVVASKLAQVTEKSLTYRIWSKTMLQYAISRTRTICLCVCANLIPRSCTYAPTLMHHSLPTLTTRYSSATLYYWQKNTIMPAFCTMPATRVAESQDP